MFAKGTFLLFIYSWLYVQRVIKFMTWFSDNDTDSIKLWREGDSYLTILYTQVI